MSAERFEIDVAVIGAGVIGLACARALALAGRDVLVLEAETMIASHTSSRNSEVIHAGLYYAKGSLKARHCVAGRRALVQYLAERGIQHNPCGKLVVACDGEEAAALPGLLQRARGNDVEELRLIEGAEARRIEGALSQNVEAAIHSPVSGIFDSHGYFLALQGDLEDAGGQVVFNSPVLSGTVVQDGIELEIGGDMPARLKACTVINAAGHWAVDIAKRIDGGHVAGLPVPRYVKGSYFSCTGATPFSRLIYPMPTSSSLGLHLTIDLGGRGKLGPDAEWLPDGAGPPFDYQVDPARADKFYSAVRRYWPGLSAGTLSPDYAGVRPKLVGEGEPSGDFRIDGPSSHGTPSLVNLLGIESPGLTSSLSIADHVATIVREMG